MNHIPFITSSSEMSKLAKLFCVALFLVGIILASLTASQISASNSASDNAADSASVSTRVPGPGHDYGAIYGNVDPGLNSTASAADPFPSFGTGHDYGAIYGKVDPGLKYLTNLPPFIVNINGQLVVRRSELGPLTQQNEKFLLSASTPSTDNSACPAPVTYTVAGVTVTRCSELGPLTMPGESASQSAGQVTGSLVFVSATLKGSCSVEPSITYSIAGVTAVRHSELGPLTNPSATSPACVP